MAVAAANSVGKSIIKLSNRLKNKESDRIKLIKKLFDAFSVKYNLLNNELIIFGDSAKRDTQVNFDCCGDHRMAMSAVIMAILTNCQLLLVGYQFVNVSFPGFFNIIEDMGVKLRYLKKS